MRLPVYLLLAALLPSMLLPGYSITSLAASAAKPQKELQELRNRLEVLQQQLSEQEESHIEATDSLKESEKAISEVNRRLHDLNVQQQFVQAQINKIEARIKQLQGKVATEKERIQIIIQTRYQASGKDTLQMILSGLNPADISRQLHYYSYISRARFRLIAQLKTDLETLEELFETSKQKSVEIKRLQSEELEGKKLLEEEKNKRQQTLSQLSSQISGQRKEISRLKQNEQDLTKIIEEINRVLEKKRAEAARKRAEHAKRQAEAARKQKQRRKQEESAEKKSASQDESSTHLGEEYSIAEQEIADDSLSGKTFASLKGKLKWPIDGDLINRFGSPRESGGLSWKGVFIKTESGQTVRAVADGHVVFADWLRGFGNLLIVDHGGGYMSLYGYNESLLKAVGDSIKSGESIAQVGNTGGNATVGLYFELRHQSKPLDPMNWIVR